MLDTPELVRLIVNKSVVTEKLGMSRIGYGRCLAVRLLVYSLQMGDSPKQDSGKFLEKKIVELR